MFFDAFKRIIISNEFNTRQMSVNNWALLLILNIFPGIAMAQSDVAQSKFACAGVVVTSDRDTGTGIVLDREGYVLTTADFLRATDQVVVNVAGGGVAIASIYSAYNLGDIALLRIENAAPSDCRIELAKTSKIKNGTTELERQLNSLTE